LRVGGDRGRHGPQILDQLQIERIELVGPVQRHVGDVVPPLE